MRDKNKRRRGASSIMAVLFVSIFSMLAMSFTSMSTTGLQTASNQQGIAQAQASAESGLQYARCLINSYTPPVGAYTMSNSVSQSQAQQTFGYFASHVEDSLTNVSTCYDSQACELTVASGSGVQLPGSQGEFSLTFTFAGGDSDNPHRMTVTSSGSSGIASRSAQLAFPIRKDSSVLEYAIASRGRMIVTGDTTIDGDVFSAWPRPDYAAPFETTEETVINGSLNTILSIDELNDENVYMETLDENDEPIFDEDGNRVYSSGDTVQGYHEGINYEQDYADMTGLNIGDYDTSAYKTSIMDDDDGDGLTIIPRNDDNITVEYFPHVPGYYNQPKASWSYKLNRHTYDGQTFDNQRLPGGRHALFQNCTFNGVLYIDHYNGTNQTINNVRFEDCTFNGPIVTSTPQNFDWRGNCLYFTGEANFDNTYMEEATILAPHYNVNLGNTAEVEEGSGSTLTGAIVGGIVDVRGNAQIDGTIISMYDTSSHPSGYVTNIGFADDGGSESSALDPADDVGVIEISPDPSRLLPSGMRTPVVIASDGNSYVEL